MYFANDLRKILPKIVRPFDIALFGFDRQLQEMIPRRGKVCFSAELSSYIETLVALHASLEDLKYSMFDQTDEDVQSSVDIAKKVVHEYTQQPEAIPRAIARSAQAEEIIVNDIKRLFDPQIVRAKTLISVAKGLQ